MTADATHLPGPEPVADLLRHQDGVVARHQLRERSWRKHDVDRMLRRREWVRLHPGVYLHHTGRPTWQQRAWGAVLAVWPAALADRSALRAVVGPGWRAQDDRLPIRVAVDHARRPGPVPGVEIVRVRDLDSRAQWHLGPPRVRIEEAVLDALGRTPGEWDRIELVAAASRSRCTTADRLRAALERRPRFPDRAWLAALLADVGSGATSVLEHGYLHRVELAHALPAAERQRVAEGPRGRVYRDADLPAYAVAVELDGRLFHDDLAQRDLDLDRDLEAAAAEDRQTLRLGWGQVFERPCVTAGGLARVLCRRGWVGEPARCGADCGLPAQWGDPRSPGEPGSPH